MRYPASGKGKPLGLMAPSGDSFQTSSLEDDDREAQGLSPKNKEGYLDSDDEAFKVFMDQATEGWKQPDYLAMVRPEDEEEARKPHGKGRVESLKFIATNYASPKRKKFNQVDAGTYQETTAHTSTTKKVTLNARMKVKPQDDWGFNFTDLPAAPPLSETERRLNKIEKDQKEELLHREVVRRHLLDLENKKELNEVLGKVADAMNSMCSDL